MWKFVTFKNVSCGELTHPARKVCSQKNTGKVWGPVGDPQKGKTYPLKGAVWYYQCLSPPRPLWAEVGRERLAGRDNPHHHTRRGSVSQAEPPLLEYFMHYVASIEIFEEDKRKANKCKTFTMWFYCSVYSRIRHSDQMLRWSIFFQRKNLTFLIFQVRAAWEGSVAKFFVLDWGI